MSSTHCDRVHCKTLPPSRAARFCRSADRTRGILFSSERAGTKRGTLQQLGIGGLGRLDPELLAGDLTKRSAILCLVRTDGGAISRDSFEEYSLCGDLLVVPPLRRSPGRGGNP